MGLQTPLAVRVEATLRLSRFRPRILEVDRALQEVVEGQVTILGLADPPNLVLTAAGPTGGIPRGTPLQCRHAALGERPPAGGRGEAAYGKRVRVIAESPTGRSEPRCRR